VLILRELTEQDEQAFFEGLKEWEGESLHWYTFDWKPGMPYAVMLDRLRKNFRGEDLPSDRVPSSMLYGFVDGQIVGRVSIRHKLNDFLRTQRGGHVGYSVAPRFRGKGYGSEMLKQAIKVCHELGINDIFITCADDNVPSYRMIEAVGGVLDKKTFDAEEGETIRWYWIKAV
jgi:predicted acetyltransferase